MTATVAKEKKKTAPSQPPALEMEDCNIVMGGGDVRTLWIKAILTIRSCSSDFAVGVERKQMEAAQAVVAQLVQVEKDFPKDPAAAEYVRLTAQLTELAEKEAAELEAARRLEFDIKQAVRQGSDPLPLRERFDKHQAEAVRLRKWAEEVAPLREEARLQAQTVLAQQLDAKRSGLDAEARTRHEKAKTELLLAVEKLLTTLRVQEFILRPNGPLSPNRLEQVMGKLS